MSKSNIYHQPAVLVKMVFVCEELQKCETGKIICNGMDKITEFDG
jgi:hypothetical protein